MLSPRVPPVLVQVRFRETVSFFNRYPADYLWKSATHVSSAGKKKGRHRYRRRIVDLNRGQIFGQGRIRTFIPGLHTEQFRTARDVLRDVEVLPPQGSLDYIPAPGFLPPRRFGRFYSPDTSEGMQASAPAVALPGADLRRKLKGVKAGPDHLEKLHEIGATIPGRKYRPPPIRSRNDFYKDFDVRKFDSDSPSAVKLAEHDLSSTKTAGTEAESGSKLSQDSVTIAKRSLHTHVSELLLRGPSFGMTVVVRPCSTKNSETESEEAEQSETGRKVKLEFEKAPESQEMSENLDKISKNSKYFASSQEQPYYEEPPYMLDVDRRSKWSIHPMIRGWTGQRPMGRRWGPPESTDGDEDFSGFDSICLEQKQVAHMDGRIGRSKAFWALMAVGNGNGLIGFAKARMPSGMAAIRSAKNRAAKRLVFVERLDERTIYQDFWAEFGHTRIFARRALEGDGLVCHRVLKAICELVGIKDIRVKVEGSTRNYLALCTAFVHGLTHQETYQQLADRKKLHVVEFDEREGYRPVVRASPRTGQVRTLDEIEPDEPRLVDEVFGEGRYPLAFKNPPPFYVKFRSYERGLRRAHKWRNHEDMRIRLQAEGVIPDFSENGRKVFALRSEQRVIDGELTIPYGIGLPSLRRYAKDEE